jgi:hypothetical protein
MGPIDGSSGVRFPRTAVRGASPRPARVASWPMGLYEWGAVIVFAAGVVRAVRTLRRFRRDLQGALGLRDSEDDG